VAAPTRGRVRGPWLAALLLALAAGACRDDGTSPTDPEDVEFHPELGVDLDAMTLLPSGVYIRTLAPGQGVQATSQDSVFVGYRGWLPGGQQFGAGSFGLRLDNEGYIDGFRFGIVGMRAQETRLIVMPSALGYGEEGSSVIPPNSVLVFEVTLQEFLP
jgi:FKBP-type peptidyl-prolyl cis-trans isomerase FkpA